jgi:hypothetical protein
VRKIKFGRKTSWLISALEMYFGSARLLRNEILACSRFGDRKGINGAVRALVSLNNEVARLLERTWRISHNPPHPEQMIEELYEAFALYSVSIELSLKDRPDLTASQTKALLASARRMTKTLRRRARTVYATLKREWPEYLHGQLEANLKRMGRL